METLYQDRVDLIFPPEVERPCCYNNTIIRVQVETSIRAPCGVPDRRLTSGGLGITPGLAAILTHTHTDTHTHSHTPPASLLQMVMTPVISVIYRARVNCSVDLGAS